MLTRQLFYRPQGQDESLSNRIEEIKFTAEVLLLQKTEEEITNVIYWEVSPQR